MRLNTRFLIQILFVGDDFEKIQLGSAAVVGEFVSP